MKSYRRIGAWIALALALLMLLPTAIADSDWWYTGIFVDTKPKKLVYEVGDSLDLTGLVLGLNREYKDGKTDVVKQTDLGGITYSPGKFTSAGEKTVTLSIKAIGKDGATTFKTSYKVTVNEEGDAPSGWTNSISITTKPKKLEYRVDDKFDPTDMVVTANQTNEGKTEKVKLPHSMLSYSPSKLTKSGKQEVKVSVKLNDKNGKTKTFSDTVMVTVYAKIKITKAPGGEKVKEGDSCNFTAHAKNYKSLEWFFEKSGTKVSASDAAKKFKGLKISGTDDEKLKLSNIPLEMDGWKVYCVFKTPVESRTTESCKLHVSKKATEKPTAAPTATPTAKATEQATAAPAITDAPAAQTGEATAQPTDPAAPDAGTTEEPTGEKTPLPTARPNETLPTEHAHSFSGDFHSDETQHWLECACGARSNVADHVVTNWTETRRATAKEDGLRTGTCAVCGAAVEESVPYAERTGADNTTAFWIAGGIGAGVLVTVPPLLIASIVMRTKEQQKRKAHKKARHSEAAPEAEQPPEKPTSAGNADEDAL